MAGDPTLRRTLPRLGFVRRAVRRFLPGEDVGSALAAAERCARQGVGAVLTHLGENVVSASEADGVRDHYLATLDLIRERGIAAEISVKLTQLGLDLDPALAERAVDELATRAERDSRWVWIDMEGSAYTERTVATYERIKRRHPLIGVCLQAYLRRSADDIRRLSDVDPAIRLVKGAYAEPRAIAYEGREVEENFLGLARALLALRGAGRPVRVVLGTHDLDLVDGVARHATSAGLARSAFEIHMLYGIRADQQQRLAREGYDVRVLISYGTAWYPWYMRRLAERPANVAFALRQLLP